MWSTLDEKKKLIFLGQFPLSLCSVVVRSQENDKEITLMNMESFWKIIEEIEKTPKLYAYFSSHSY
jgi:flavodoxin